MTLRTAQYIQSHSKGCDVVLSPAYFIKYICHLLHLYVLYSREFGRCRTIKWRGRHSMISRPIHDEWWSVVNNFAELWNEFKQCLTGQYLRPHYITSIISLIVQIGLQAISLALDISPMYLLKTNCSEGCVAKLPWLCHSGIAASIFFVVTAKTRYWFIWQCSRSMSESRQWKMNYIRKVMHVNIGNNPGKLLVYDHILAAISTARHIKKQTIGVCTSHGIS